MTDPFSSPSRRYPPLKAAELTALSLASVGRSFGPLLPVWVAMAVLNGAVFVGLGAWLTAHPDAPDFPLGLNLAQGVVAGLGDGLLSAYAIRSFVRGEAREADGRWRLDLGLAGFLVIQLVMAMAETLAPGLVTRAVGGGAAAAQSPAMLAVAFVAWALIVLVEMRLVLWQVALLMRQPGVGPLMSWRAMGGAMGSYVMAYVTVSGLPAVVYLFAWSGYLYSGSAVALGAAVVAFCVGGMATAALAAHVFRIRSGGAMREMASAFD